MSTLLTVRKVKSNLAKGRNNGAPMDIEEYPLSDRAGQSWDQEGWRYCISSSSQTSTLSLSLTLKKNRYKDRRYGKIQVK